MTGRVEVEGSETQNITMSQIPAEVHDMNFK